MVLFSRKCALVFSALVTVVVKAADVPDFNREVRPILSNYCFKCHGPDDKARKSKLRLDVREEALKPAKSGDTAIVPGKVDESQLVARIFSDDEEERMPPAATKKELSAAQKDVLKRWIAGGAKYDPHWAFVAPKQAVADCGSRIADLEKRDPARAAELRAWPKNPIDEFVLARLLDEGLQPSPEADAVTLCRRLFLDLTGLPPTPEEANAFVQSPIANRQSAIESLVDKLLASPHYGERWARRWLDLARYADTNGYEKDRDRSIWPWRDWVIGALNADMPFDQFTIEQLAGDLLPNATREQIVATGFHRNTMLNEEGGIDPLEFRFHAMTDRVATTGVTWLGLTVGCAQCHTHKFDPIPHREYYQMMAFLNNADEPELDLPAPDAAVQRRARDEQIAKLLAELPDQWPVDAGDVRWDSPRPVEVKTASGEVPRVLDDGSALFAAPGPDADSATFTFDTDATGIDRVRMEALTHESLPLTGPGRVAHGNFVLSEIVITAAPKSTPEKTVPVTIVSATADAEQEHFPVAAAFDGDLKTGWAVHVPGKTLNAPKTAVFMLKDAIGFPDGTRIVVRLEQRHGSTHTIGRPRVSFGTAMRDAKPLTERRREILEKKFAEWLARERERNIAWTTLRPVEAKSNMPLLAAQPDGSIFGSGDITKADTYELKFANMPRGITAIRLEAMPDERLPNHGPGMTFYEGPKGDFFMGEFQASADGQPVKFGKATQSYANNAMGGAPATAALAIDGDPQTGWSTSGREGEANEAVFQLAAPLAGARELSLKMMFGRHYACSLGRFRISATTDPRGAEAREIPDEIARLLALPDARLTAEQRGKLREHFFLTAPELAEHAKKIRELRKPIVAGTTLVLRERPPENPRPTFIHNRGEFLQPTDRVEPGVFSFLPPLAGRQKADRLAFARWLVSPENPLTARVTVNRQWAILFGRGLVRTTEDFGYQGEPPTHPELLDWLAVEFVKQGWSLKKLHRLIVTSATYWQSSRVTPELLAKDAENKLLARGPRARLEAEMIRDTTLRAAGLLSEKIGGPSVRPPQPDGVSEVAYGGAAWNASGGEDRYRRGLYTFAKRTAPYAMLTTFDAPTGEACIARRDVSNSPLQALTLLNDVVFVEAAQALGKMLASQSGGVEERIASAFRRILTRPPTADETARLVKFFTTQKARFISKELDAKAIAGEGSGDVDERAAWTTLARSLFNLDETITKS